MCRGWSKSLENRCPQRHLAGSLLLRPQAMWPLAVWLGSDPSLSTYHELATVTCIQSRGQHMLGLRSSNAYSCPGVDRESTSRVPSGRSVLPPNSSAHPAHRSVNSIQCHFLRKAFLRLHWSYFSFKSLVTIVGKCLCDDCY